MTDDDKTTPPKAEEITAARECFQALVAFHRLPPHKQNWGDNPGLDLGTLPTGIAALDALEREPGLLARVAELEEDNKRVGFFERIGLRQEERIVELEQRIAVLEPSLRAMEFEEAALRRDCAALNNQATRVAELEAAVARVMALADKWTRHCTALGFLDESVEDVMATQLRAALVGKVTP